MSSCRHRKGRIGVTTCKYIFICNKILYSVLCLFCVFIQWPVVLGYYCITTVLSSEVMTKSKKMTIFVFLAHKKGLKMQENNCQEW